jgi:predicted 3-demethylubiquinone-9 3-methyltransferase (glyoxalase superfamily)
MKQSETKLQIINDNIELLGQIESICQGLKVSTVRRYRDYYYAVDAYMQQGAKKTEAVTWVADDFGVSCKTVWMGLGVF